MNDQIVPKINISRGLITIPISQQSLYIVQRIIKETNYILDNFWPEFGLSISNSHKNTSRNNSIKSRDTKNDNNYYNNTDLETIVSMLDCNTDIGDSL